MFEKGRGGGGGVFLDQINILFYLPSWIEEPIGTISKGCVFRCVIVNIPFRKPSPEMFTILYSKHFPSEYLLYSKPSPWILYYIVNIPSGKIYYIANIPSTIADHSP